MKKNSHQRNLFGDARQLSLFHDQAAARPANLWSEADVIATYSRLQAIEDGVLVQLSGPGYQGDAWVPEMVAECGYKIPLAITAAAFGRVREACAAAGRPESSMVYSIAHPVCCGRTPAELAQRAAAIGRDLDELRASGLAGSPAEIADKLGTFGQIGTQTAYLQMLDLHDLDHLELLASLLGQVA